MSAATRQMAQVQMHRHPAESAQLLERHTPEEIVAFLQQAAADGRTAVLARLSPALGAACLERMPRDIAGGRADRLGPRPSLPLCCARLDPAIREDALEAVAPSVRILLGRALAYPDGSAGALADASTPTLSEDLTVEGSADAPAQ